MYMYIKYHPGYRKDKKQLHILYPSWLLSMMENMDFICFIVFMIRKESIESDGFNVRNK